VSAVDAPCWAREEADALLMKLADVPLASVAVRWRVRVDEPHPRRREKIGDFIDFGDGHTALAARYIWSGWTPGYVLHIAYTDGTTVTGPWSEQLVCCDMHNRHCEPPSELCCEYCAEAFHPKHAVMPCVLDA
jgi:hypothetical protein